MEAPAAIPGFGTITLKMQPAQQRFAVFGKLKRLRSCMFLASLSGHTLIDPERAFLDKFALQTTDASRQLAHSRQIIAGSAQLPSGKKSFQSPLLRKRHLASVQPSQQQEAFSFMEMAACCASTTPIDAAKAQEWLQEVILKIGETMNQCKRVRL